MGTDVLENAIYAECGDKVSSEQVADTEAAVDENESNLDEFMDMLILIVILISMIVWYLRDAQNKRQFAKEREAMRKLRAKMTIPPRDDWTVAELQSYTGGPEDDPEPILFAAKGCVYNVWRGRHFYGCEGAYHCFAGRDATTMLALELLDEPTQEQQDRPLTREEINFLNTWISTYEWKYDNLGSLAPGEGIWEKEPEKRKLWDEYGVLLLRFFI